MISIRLIQAYFNGSVSAKMKLINCRSFHYCVLLSFVHLSLLVLQHCSALQQSTLQAFRCICEGKLQCVKVKDYFDSAVSAVHVTPGLGQVNLNSVNNLMTGQNEN